MSHLGHKCRSNDSELKVDVLTVLVHEHAFLWRLFSSARGSRIWSGSFSDCIQKLTELDNSYLELVKVKSRTPQSSHSTPNV